MAHFVIQWPVELCSAKKLRERFRKAKLGQNLNNFRSEFLGTEKFFGKYLKKLTTLLRIFWGKQSWEREREKCPKETPKREFNLGPSKYSKKRKQGRQTRMKRKPFPGEKFLLLFVVFSVISPWAHIREFSHFQRSIMHTHLSKEEENCFHTSELIKIASREFASFAEGKKDCRHSCESDEASLTSSFRLWCRSSRKKATNVCYFYFCVKVVKIPSLILTPYTPDENILNLFLRRY